MKSSSEAHFYIAELLHTARNVTERYLDDLTDADLLVRVHPRAHNVAWQLGHLVVSEAKMIAGAVAGLQFDLSVEFLAQHSKEGDTFDEYTCWHSKEHYLELLRSTRQVTLNALSALSPEEMATPGPEEMRGYAPTVGSAFVMVGSHELMHSGQIAVLRRFLDKRVVL
jgi:hypothetical protein